MFRSATCARIIPKEFSEKYLYHWIKYIFFFIPLSVSHSAAGSSHSIEMSSLHNNFHFNDTTFKIYCIHWELYSCCHTSHLSHCTALFWNIILKQYFGAIFLLLHFLSPHHSSKLSITIIGAYLLFSIFSIMQQFCKQSTDFCWRENCTWRKFLNMFCIILHIYILTEQSPEYHLQNMHSFWKLLKSCRAKKSFGTCFYIAFTLRKASLEWDNP